MANNNSQGKYSSPVTATLKGISDLFRERKPDVEIPTADDLDQKTVLITGASSGLGYATAQKLAQRGARVIMACRSGIPERGEQIRKMTGNEEIHMIHVDVSEPASIQNLVKELKSRNERLDILILNAAIVPAKSRKTEQGLEEMFMVNYLAKFILIKQLRGAGIFATKPKIIIVSSESHRNPKGFEWDEFGDYKEYTMGKVVERYGYFKLLLTTFGQELSRKFPDAQVFTLCPGPVNSNIAREAPKLFQPLLKLVFSIFFRSPEKASDPVVYFATSNGEVKTGSYLFLLNWKDVDEKASDRENGKRLWQLSEELYDRLY